MESLNSFVVQEQSPGRGLKRHCAQSPADSSHGQTSEAEMAREEVDATAEADCSIQQPQGDAVPASGQHGTPALHQSTSTLSDPHPSGRIRGRSGAIRSWHEVMQNIAALPEEPCSSLQNTQQQATLRHRSVLEAVDYAAVDSCLLLPAGWSFTSQGGEINSNLAKTDAECCGAVLEWHMADQLMDCNNQPKDLLRLWKTGDVVRAMIGQVYTYMLLWGLRYGCVSCYYSTWLLYCPGDDRNTLYISNCILASAEHTPEQPQLTALGAMAMMTYLALATARLPVQPYCAEGLAEGLAGGRASSSRPGRRQGGHAPQHMHVDQAALGARDIIIQLEAVVCSSSASTVVRGRWWGDPAVFKLHGPDVGWQEWETEVGMYDRLSAEQGKLLPRMLGHGSIIAGVKYIALENIDGVPLSDLPYITEKVAAAAFNALVTLQQRHPGFVHGDIRLQNIMLLATPRPGESSTCMLLDLAWSQMDGSEAQQEHEVQEFTQLIEEAQREAAADLTHSSAG
eukprot:jgi/Chrzof1/2159/Cz11g04140.t1